MEGSGFIRRVITKIRFGEPVIIVSGLPRSGTSMLMNMLAAGGIEVLQDGERAADPDNPLGYFELERVKHLDQSEDKSWLADARGRALKVISHLLKELPSGNAYNVLFVRRDLGEVIASQNAMLSRRGETNPIADARARELYRRHLVNVRVLARRRPDFRMIEIEYEEVIAEPWAAAARISSFLDRPLNLEQMAGIVDERLYRNRRTSDARVGEVW